MAINGAVESEYGIDFMYHKLREVRVINDDKGGVQLVLTVYSWANKQARIDGKRASVRQCIISNADFALTPFYALLKAKFPEFTDGDNDYNNDFKGAIQAVKPEFFEQTGNGDLIGRWKENDETEETEPAQTESAGEDNNEENTGEDK